MMVAKVNMPVLYETGPRDFAQDVGTFSTQGVIGFLNNTISCTVTEERHGRFDLELKYPTDANLADEITLGRIIVAYCGKQRGNKNRPWNDYEPFEIIKIKRTRKTITVNAQHLCMSAYTMYVKQMSEHASGATVGTYLNDMKTQVGKVNGVDICPFTINVKRKSDGTLATLPAMGEVYFPKPFADCMYGSKGSIIDKIGGDFFFRNLVVNYYPESLNGTNDNSMYMISDMLNMSECEISSDLTSVSTHDLPYWAGQKEDGTEDFVIGTNFDKDIFDPEGLTPHLMPRVRLIDLSEAIGSTKPTSTQLFNALMDYYTNHTLGVDVWENMSITLQIPNADLRTCDMVMLTDGSKKQKITKTVYNSLTGTLMSVNIGTIKKTMYNSVLSTIKTAYTNRL